MASVNEPLVGTSKHNYFMPNYNKANVPLASNSSANGNASKTNANTVSTKAQPQTSRFHRSPTPPQATNMGPFSPNMFALRRVWVKRQQGTPTTIIVHQNDIIDDLKQAVVNKYPNSLAREVDPADLTIKMNLQYKPGQPNSVKKPPFLLSSPDNLKNTQSPISQTPTSNQPHSTTYSCVNLEPDQNVWSILDHYYPNEMSIHEAFIIETPALDMNRNSFNLTSFYNNQSTLFQKPNPVQHGRTSNSFTASIPHNQPNYYQPKPQHINTNVPNSLSFNQMHDKSVSPSTLYGRQSPLSYGANIHKRSHSNPPGSPSLSSSNIVSNNTSENSQAVLLLPKNFALATGTGTNNNTSIYDKKRLSLDETFVQKNRNNESMKSPSTPSSNLTNIGEGIHSQSHSVPKYDRSPKVDHGTNDPKPNDKSGDDHKLDLGNSNSGSGLMISPQSFIHDSMKNDSNSNSIKVNVRLNGSDGDRSATVAEAVSSNEDVSLKTPAYIAPSISPSLSKIPKMTKPTTDTVLPSISVLVVEDNAINQAILGAFLRKHKIPYKIAKNGQEAVDKWRTGGFHLVLMDIQLPVKSGIDATKEIRYLEKVNKIGVFAQHELSHANYSHPSELKEEDRLDLSIFRSPVIIVALTASSNSSVDRKNALRAGCNDYLTKPVNLVWLQNKITEWGCMQALIDFDGWKIKRSSSATNVRPQGSHDRVHHDRVH